MINKPLLLVRYCSILFFILMNTHTGLAYQIKLELKDHFPNTNKILNPFEPKFFVPKPKVENIKPADSQNQQPVVPDQPAVEADPIESVDPTAQLTENVDPQYGYTDPQYGYTGETGETEIDLNFSVSGVVWNTDRPQAIINAQIVDVGDIVNDAKIISIDKQAIEVEYNGYRKTVTP